MNKIDKARTIVMMTDSIRDALLSNLDAFPEDWDVNEVQQAVLMAAHAQVDDLGPAREKAFLREYLARMLDKLKTRPDARVENTVFGETILALRTPENNYCDTHRIDPEG